MFDSEITESPIVLVHGYMDSGNMPWWSRIERYLDELGFDTDRIRVANLGDVPGTTTGSPRDYAREVRREVESLYDRYGQVNVLGHSMGGIDARWYVEKMGGEDLVDNLMTLGTPHQGTYAAYLGYLSQGGRSLTPSSDLIATLNEDGPAESVTYTSVWGKADALVVPSDHGRLPWNGEQCVRNVAVGLYGHLSLIFRKSLVKKYLRFFGNAPTACRR